MLSLSLGHMEKQEVDGWMNGSDNECTHQMGLFDTHFVQFGQVLPVLWLKLLVTSN